MTDYTPTEAEVRDAYVIGAAGMATYSGNGTEDDEANEFDRFIASVREAAWEEGNRIAHAMDGDDEPCFCANNPYRLSPADSTEEGKS